MAKQSNNIVMHSTRGMFGNVGFRDAYTPQRSDRGSGKINLQVKVPAGYSITN